MADLKKIKGLFWREPGKTSEPESVAPIAVPTMPAVTPLPPLQQEPLDEEFFGAIDQEMRQSMPADFAEFFSQMLVINEKFSNLDQKTRYQLAFHAAQTALKTRNEDLTYNEVLKAMDNLSQILQREKNEFQTQNEQGYQANLQTIQSKVNEIAQGIKAREERLQALQKEMDHYVAVKNQEKAKLEQERSDLISQRVVTESEINNLEKKKTDREARFNSALAVHRDRIEKLRTELASYLQELK